MSAPIQMRNASLRKLIQDESRPLLIKEWREERGFTQGELAALAGCSLTTLNEIETGKRPPRISTLSHIAAALGIHPSRLAEKPGAQSRMGIISEVQKQTAAVQEAISRDVLPRLERLADELLEVANSIFVRRVPYSEDNGADVMSLTFTTKQIEHLRSVRTLIAHTCHRDALLIARTMIEGLARILWAFLEVPARTDLWFQFGAILDWRRIVRLDQQGKEIVDPADKAALKTFLDVHGPTYYKKAVRNGIADAAKNNTPYQIPDDPWDSKWTSTTVKEMFDEVGGTRHHESWYGESSEWIHWGPRALVGAMNITEWGTEGFTKEDWRKAAIALQLACQSLWQSLLVLNSHFSLGLDDRLNVLGDDLERELLAAIETGKKQQ